MESPDQHRYKGFRNGYWILNSTGIPGVGLPPNPEPNHPALFLTFGAIREHGEISWRGMGVS